jgi:hypothetical protein
MNFSYSSPDKLIQFKVTSNLLQQMNHAAKCTQQPRSQLIRRAVQQYISDLEKHEIMDTKSAPAVPTSPIKQQPVIKQTEKVLSEAPPTTNAPARNPVSATAEADDQFVRRYDPSYHAYVSNFNPHARQTLIEQKAKQIRESQRR